MYLLALLPIALVASTVSAQVVGVCDDYDSRLGVFFKPHEVYCSLYYQCMPDRTAVVMSCPEGTLFDDVNRICQHPQLTSCRNKQCGGSFGQNTSWAHVCCDQYIGCKGNKHYIGRCAEGTVFNSKTGKCVRNQPCELNTQCRRLYSAPTSEPVCTRRAVANEPCKFEEFDGNGNPRGIKSCAAGTAYNPTLCNCGTYDKRCMRGVALAVDNRVIDPQCRATMVLDFNSVPPVSYTMKTTTGQRLMNNYSIGYEGYTPSGSEGIFASYADGHAHLYFWTFVQNMLAGPFGIKATFRVNNPQEGYNFILVGNDMSSERSDCAGTLNIGVAYQNRQWVITFDVVAVDTRNGQRNSVREVQSVRAGNDYVTVSFMMSRASKTMSGFIRTQGTNSVAWGPIDLGGDQIDINSCPLTAADGLEGSLSELQFFEACGDESILARQLQ